MTDYTKNLECFSDFVLKSVGKIFLKENRNYAPMFIRSTNVALHRTWGLLHVLKTLVQIKTSTDTNISQGQMPGYWEKGKVLPYK